MYLDAETLAIARFTALMAGVATLIALPLAVLTAWLLARSRIPGRAVIEALASLPLVLPPVATGLILLRLLGQRSPVGRTLDAMGVEIIFTWKAVVLAMAVMEFPLIVRAVRAGIEGVDTRFEHVAATLGARPLRVFLTVTLPLAARGVLAGALLGYSRALGEFGATIMVAGSIPGRTRTLAVGIYDFVETGHEDRAIALLVVSLCLSFGAILLSNFVGSRDGRA